MDQAYPTVTALPANPVNGMVVYYLADSTNGVVWPLKYRSASASTYKWECVGGPPLYAEVQTAESTSSTSYTNLATTGPSITVPLEGDYVVSTGCAVANGGAVLGAFMSYAIGASAAADADGCFAQVATPGFDTSVSRARLKTGLAASTALVAKYKNSGAAAIQYTYRWMRVEPRRVI